MRSLEGLNLNEWAASVAEDLLDNADVLGCAIHDIAGAQVVDCGVETRGSLEAGQLMALVCMADLADVDVHLDRLEGRLLPKITVSANDPTVGCLLSQYAGWRIADDDYFAIELCAGATVTVSVAFPYEDGHELDL